MKIFFYMGRNTLTKSGVSWKIWKINRVGRKVTTLWGRATVVKRRVVPLSLQTATRSFPTPRAAQEFEAQRIRSKITKGYERRTRFKP
jgi:hypothetical protein